MAILEKAKVANVQLQQLPKVDHQTKRSRRRPVLNPSSRGAALVVRDQCWSIAVANNPKSSDQAVDSIETLATTLRVKVTNFLKVNCNRWKDSWYPDEAANTVTEDGVPAQDFKVLDRSKRWLCGLGLTATALQQRCSIVIWQYSGTAKETHDQSKWRRVAIIKGNEGNDNGKHPIIPLVLHKGHYYGLRLPPLRKSWPREWIVSPEEEGKAIPVTQGVEETSVLATICRGGGQDEFETPIKNRGNNLEEMLKTFSSRRTKTSGRHPDVEEMLRTCSSIVSGAKSSCSKDKKHIIKKPASWTCPVCQETIELVKGKKTSDHIYQHLRRQHAAIFLNALEENKKRNRYGAGLNDHDDDDKFCTQLPQPIHDSWIATACNNLVFLLPVALEAVHFWAFPRKMK